MRRRRRADPVARGSRWVAVQVRRAGRTRGSRASGAAGCRRRIASPTGAPPRPGPVCPPGRGEGCPSPFGVAIPSRLRSMDRPSLLRHGGGVVCESACVRIACNLVRTNHAICTRNHRVNKNRTTRGAFRKRPRAARARIASLRADGGGAASPPRAPRRAAGRRWSWCRRADPCARATAARGTSSARGAEDGTDGPPAPQDAAAHVAGAAAPGVAANAKRRRSRAGPAALGRARRCGVSAPRAAARGAAPGPCTRRAGGSAGCPPPARSRAPPSR